MRQFADEIKTLEQMKKKSCACCDASTKRGWALAVTSSEGAQYSFGIRTDIIVDKDRIDVAVLSAEDGKTIRKFEVAISDSLAEEDLADEFRFAYEEAVSQRLIRYLAESGLPLTICPESLVKNKPDFVDAVFLEQQHGGDGGEGCAVAYQYKFYTFLNEGIFVSTLFAKGNTGNGGGWWSHDSGEEVESDGSDEDFHAVAELMLDDVEVNLIKDSKVYILRTFLLQVLFGHMRDFQ